MLCVSNVALSDWPLGERRDVDHEHPRIRGLLKAGYIVPLVVPRRPRETPPKPLEARDERQAAEAAGSPDAPRSTAKRVRSKPDGA